MTADQGTRSILTGADRVLRAIPLICAALFITLLLFSGWPRQHILLACILIPATASISLVNTASARLILGKAGEIRWRDRRGNWHTARLTNGCWASPRYAVLCWRNERNSGRFLVSRNLQSLEDYKMVSGWVRLVNCEQA